MKALVAALAFVPAVALAQQQDFSKVEVKSAPVAGNVHMLTGEGGNIGVSVGPDGVLIVDDQFAPLAPKIKAALAKLSQGKIRVRAQHALALRPHGRQRRLRPGGPHRRARAGAHAADERSWRSRRWGRFRPRPRRRCPVITYDNGMSLYFNGEEIRLTHLPAGHTDGDTMVYFTGSNVMHLGDQFSVDTFPFFDMESGGTPDGYLANLEKLVQTLPPGVKIIPGHGPLAGRRTWSARWPC